MFVTVQDHYLYFSIELSMILWHRSPKDIPTAAASCGSSDVGVMPGSVFVSRQ